MTEEKSGWDIALERIEREASERTGFLDLGRLGLTELPEEMFQLTHLRALNLGSAIPREGGGWRRAASDIAPNDIGACLEQLGRLPTLEALHLRDSRFASLAKLTQLSRLEVLDCSGTQVDDLAPLASLGRLRVLMLSGTTVRDLAPLRGCLLLERLDFSWTQVSQLEALAVCAALLWLDCSGTLVHDLKPLATLSSLLRLDCSHTKVTDLAPVANLVAIRDLSCWDTQIHNLEPLKALFALQTLFCHQSEVSDLSPIAELSSLQEVICSNTQVSDLEPLAGLASLKFLSLTQTKVTDLGSLRGLVNLQQLSCGYTEINGLSPLAGLTALREVLCDRTRVGDLTPLAALPNLRRLECSHCRLINFPIGLLGSKSLAKLTLYNSFVPGVPAEVMSQSRGDNCLESLRAHFRDLEAGAVATTEVKLVILGNGRVGKTQICRRLRGEDYDPSILSTHGIKVGSASLPMADGKEPIKLHIWDFGGQDIYHGTHALFMKTNAVFMLVWTPEMEASGSCDHDGFRNYPLAYWVDYVRHLGGKDVPVLIVQTRCDRAQDKADCPVAEADLRKAFGNYEVLRYSAKNDRGRSALDEALQEAVRWLHDRQGIETIGAGRQRVKLRLESMRAADADVPAEQRQYRTITQAHFQQICTEENGTSDPRYLLAYLHNAGIVFYRERLFDDRIVLDQQWALDAIYAVFDREKCVKLLRQQHGRFTRSLLELIVWQGYTPEEQELFLGMTRSCGICFVHKHGDKRLGIEPEYIAPDVLPEKRALATELAEKWDPAAHIEEAEWEFDLLHQGLIRAILSRIGGEAGVSATYWQGGLCVFETSTRSHALIEQEMGEGWAGRIRLQTQGGQATALLERLSELIEEEIQRLGLASCRAPRMHRVEIHETLHLGATAETVAREPTLTYGEPRTFARSYYVSYAWADPSPEGKDREAMVDRLCAAAEGRGTPIIRDKTTLKVGDSIAKFMRRIGQGDRIFVFLSNKYLKSPFCMFELFEIWRNSRQEEEEFLKRSRVFCLDDAQIGTMLGRLHYAEHWKTEHDQIKAVIDRSGASILGEKDFAQFKLMQQFADHVGDILRMFADIVQPRSFEELERYGFDDPPDSSTGSDRNAK